MNLNRESHVNEIAVRARLFDQAEFEVKIRNPLRRVPKVVPYEAGAIDRDNDMLVQEGTIWERPAGSRFITKLGKELAAGLRAIPSASRLVDGNGKDIDYKPGDRSMGARGRERRLAGRGQRRLRRADRRLARADRQEARADEIENLDELIARIDAAASEASRERLLAAEAARGDDSMDEDYRSFWDAFMEGWTGVNQQHNRGSGPRAEIVRALKATRKLEGERRQAGDAAGNAPDRDRESEFDEIGLPDGVDLEEHERRMREDPEYREAFIESLVAGEMDVPGQEEAAEEATEDVADAVEDLVPETPESEGGGPPDPEADLPDEPTRVRMRPEAMEHLLTQADSNAIHAIIRDEDDGFVAAGLRVDNMPAEVRAEWINKANWESRRRTVGEMSDEELEQDLETIGGWAENDPGREQWLALLTAERDRRAVDAGAAPENRGYEFTGQDPNNPWENFDEEANGRRHEIIRNLSPEERAQIIDSAAGVRAGEHLGPDDVDALAGWPAGAGPEPMDEEGLFVAAAYAEEFQRYNNFVGEGDLAARMRREGRPIDRRGNSQTERGDTDPRGDTRGEIEAIRGNRARWEELQEIIAEQRRERQPLDQQPDPELVREFEVLDEQFGLPTSGDEGIPAIKYVEWNGVVLDSEAIANRERSIASLNDKQRAQILNGEWPTEALGPRPNEAGMNNAKFYVRRHMGSEGREAGRPEDLGDGVEGLDARGVAERLIAAVQADPVGDDEDRDVMERLAARHGLLMDEQRAEGAGNFDRARMEILANMDDNELAEHIELQRNHIINFNDSGDVLRRRTAADELARALRQRGGREAFDEEVADGPDGRWPGGGPIDPGDLDPDDPTIRGEVADGPNPVLPDVDQMEIADIMDEMAELRDLYDGESPIPDVIGRRYQELYNEHLRARPNAPVPPQLRNRAGLIANGDAVTDRGGPRPGDRPDTPDSGVDEIPEIPPVPELSDVPTDLEPINNIAQQNHRRVNNSDVVSLYKRDIKTIQKRLATRNGVPTGRNDGRMPNGLERMSGHEANVDRALADVDRRLALLPRQGQSDEKRKLQGLKRSLRKLKNEKIPEERQRRQVKRDAERAQRQQRHRDFVTAHRELGVFNREWDEADLDAVVANNMDDEAVLARIAADADFLNQHIPHLRSGSWDPDEGEAPSDMAEINRRAREIVAALKAKKIIVNKRKVFRQNREFIGANEPRFREIEAHINGMPEDAEIPADMARDLLDIKNGILDRTALPRMGTSNPDPDLQALIDRKMALESDIKSLVRANKQRIDAPVVRQVLDGVDPRLAELRVDVGRGGETLENQVDVHIAEVQAMLDEIGNLPQVTNLATLDQRRKASKAAVEQLAEDLRSFRRNVALGDLVDPVGSIGVGDNPSRMLPQGLGGGLNPRPRPAGLGLPGHIDDQGNVVIDSVSVGHMGMNVQLDADRHVRSGGDLSDVPDAFLGNAILNNAAGVQYPDGESYGPRHVSGASIGNERFLLVAANKGNIGTTYVLAQRRPDGSIGNEGVFIKIAKSGYPGQEARNTDFDALGELFGIEVAHRLGLPTMPGREDGQMLGRGPNQNGQGEARFNAGQTGRAIVLEHAWNMAEDFDDVVAMDDFLPERMDTDVADAALEGRVSNLLVNYVLGMPDRHRGNALIGGTRVTDANGNEVIKTHVYPADLAWVGREGAARITGYHTRFTMDRGLLNDIARVAGADPARKEALRDQVTEMLNRLQSMINDPNLRERMINREEFLAAVDSFRQSVNRQFNLIAPNGVVPIDQILTDLGLT